VRAFVQRSLTCAIVGVAAGASALVLAQQPVEEPEEIVVRGKPLNRYRAEIELARDEMIRIFNEANEDDDNDVRCRYEAPTGSRIPQRVCFSAAQDRASANAALDFLQEGTRSAREASLSTGTGLGSAPNTAGEGSSALV
jgi:hypothetical protein